MPDQVLTLHDIAALLRGFERSDKADLAMLRDSLALLSAEHRVSHAAQPFVDRAAALLGAIVDGKGAEKAASLADVGRALASALAARVDECLPDDTDAELLREFLAESREYAGASEMALLQLEKNPADQVALGTVFRAFHTIKGNAAFLGLARVAAFAHEAESLLSKVRDGDVVYARGCAELSLRAVDMLGTLLSVVADALAGDGRLPVPEGYLELIDALAGYDPSHDSPAHGLPAHGLAAPGLSAHGAQALATLQAAEARKMPEPSHDPTVRVRTERLDQFIDLVDELVVAHAYIASERSIDANRNQELIRRLAHATGIARELQRLGMAMRMVPLRTTFSRLARVVRDASFRVGNSVGLVTDGGEIEIDRAIVEMLADPLMHMVRNAVDHGIETPDERALAHKPSRGTITLSAFEDKGEVVVELHDDGRGLHRDRIVARAVERGLIESDHGLRDTDVFALLFVPGFTTAERVTDVSGRGVGMDVVRRNLDALHGRIEIRSDAGQGTTFVLRVPLTAAPVEEAQPDHDEPSLFPVLSPSALDACSDTPGRIDAAFSAP